MDDIFKSVIGDMLKSGFAGINAKNVMKFVWVMLKKKVAHDIAEDFFKRGSSSIQINREDFEKDMASSLAKYEDFFYQTMEEFDKFKKETK